jgi:hypothetical protein
MTLLLWFRFPLLALLLGMAALLVWAAATDRE